MPSREVGANGDAYGPDTNQAPDFPANQGPFQNPEQAPINRLDGTPLNQSPQNVGSQEQPGQANPDGDDSYYRTEGDGDKSQYCQDNVSVNPDGSVNVKDFSPFVEGHNSVNEPFFSDEKVIEYDQQTKYGNAVDEAVARWNKLGVVKFRKDTAWIAPELSISDDNFPFDPNLTNEPVELARWTHHTGLIDFIDLHANIIDLALKSSEMNGGITEEQLIGLIVHELGHALGLDHSCVGTVMYYATGPLQTTSPSPIDIAVYHHLWG